MSEQSSLRFVPTGAKHILFRPRMVNALRLVERPKTQTRRIVKDPDQFGCFTGDCPHSHRDECAAAMAARAPNKVGDVLWVKEAWETRCYAYDAEWSYLADRVCEADGGSAIWHRVPEHAPADWQHSGPDCLREHDWLDYRGNVLFQDRVRASIHFPKWACRLLLNVTEVRHQHVCEISPEDAIAEGFTSPTEFLEYFWSMNGLEPGSNPWVRCYTIPRREIRW